MPPDEPVSSEEPFARAKDAAEWLIAHRARDHEAGSIGDMPADLQPPSLAAAYDVQQAFTQLRQAAGSGPAAGWKIGATTSAMQALLKIDHPAAGRVIAADVLESGAVLPYSRFRRPGVECEIAVHIEGTLDARLSEVTIDDVRAAVGAAYAAIEVIDDRHGSFDADAVRLLVADGFYHGALVLGQALGEPGGLDYGHVAGTLRINGKEAAAGIGRDVLGDPLNAVLWLVQHLAARGECLEHGQLVSTGSLTLPVWVAAGDEAEIEMAGFGSVSVSFTD